MCRQLLFWPKSTDRNNNYWGFASYIDNEPGGNKFQWH